MGMKFQLMITIFGKLQYGKVEIDKQLADHIKFTYDSEAHKYEHSGEVMLPMLQYFLNYEFSILPITMSVQNFHNAQLIASKIYLAALKLHKRICFIASSDFSHYVKPEIGKIQNTKVIQKILEFDYEGILIPLRKIEYLCVATVRLHAYPNLH